MELGKRLSGKETSGNPIEARVDRWLVMYLAVLTGEKSEAIDRAASLSAFDIDSVDAVEMAAEFEKAFDCEVDPEFFLRGRESIAEMVPFLAEVAGADQQGRPRTSAGSTID
jgi:acyl carrier protein